MSQPANFGYEDKRALVVGGASGMGAAAASAVESLGGDVIVLDQKPIPHPTSQTIQVDIRDLQALDDVLGGLEAPFQAVFSAAGVADGTPGIMKANFIAHRHIIETLVARGLLSRGGSVCMISSVAGLGWESQMPRLLEFLATPDFETADEWVQAHEGTDTYVFSKQAMNCYVARQSYPFLAKGIRINAICPGPTDTPLARANAETWLAFAQGYRDATAMPYLSATQMGDTMAFLNSDAASGISGITVLVDAGHVMASLTGAWAPDQPMIRALMARD
jgi:NAD(P)-dependent dehydrogenase (short-subunit alcohol dehydrogenase family)